MKTKILYTAFFIISISLAFLIGQNYQKPNFNLVFDKKESYGQIGTQLIEFADLPGNVQINLVKLESQKRQYIKDSIKEIMVSKLNHKYPEILKSLKESKVSDSEIENYIKDNKLIVDDSLKERVKNKLFVDKQNIQKNELIKEYSNKEKITLVESSLKKLVLDEKNSLNLNNQGSRQLIFFIDFEKTSEVDKMKTMVHQLKDVSVSIYPLVRNNPYRDENLLKFVCIQNSSNGVNLEDFNKSYLTVEETYKCSKEVVQNNLYNVANYAKSIGIYSSGVLVEGLWVDLSDDLTEVLEKRLLK